ncbi:hypothetical protein F1D05_00905 [Kribbella qitaiheensis]|uniref:LamG domain-containing protein n=1 Tax=Kribbella qitaiheensis TaxID=1544730 RepID=A0A7G6WRV4_9ACTN|nr:hypothetical protein F1D05_00905 [Kribbella qitaiheensis]
MKSLAMLGMAAGAAPAAWPAHAVAADAELDVRTLQPSDLSFSTTALSVPYSIISPNFVRLDDSFADGRSPQSELLRPTAERAAGVSVGDGAFRANGREPYFTLVKSSTGQEAPYCAVIVDVESLAEEALHHNTVLTGLVRDERNYLLGWYNHASRTTGIDVCVDGEVHTLGQVTAELTTPFRLALTATGPGANVFVRDEENARGWRVLTGSDQVGTLLDLRGLGRWIANAAFDTAPVVPADGTQGQLFTVDEPFTKVGSMFGTWQATDCAFTLTLRREGPAGAEVTRSRLTDVPDNSWQYLDLAEPLPAGTYYLEVSNPSSKLSWWGNSDDVIAWGQAYENGRPVTGDRTIRVMFPPAGSAEQMLAAYRNGFGVRADAGTIVLSRVQAGYYGQAGIRDPVIVSLPDGRPYIRGHQLYFTLTNHGLAGGIPAAHMGVFRMDLRDYTRVEEIGKIYQQRRDGAVLGDHAGQVIYDPAIRRFRVLAVTFGDADVYGDFATEYTTSGADVLHGVHLLRSKIVAQGIDPYAVRVDGRWRLALSLSGRTYSYAFGDDDFREPMVAGVNDNAGIYYEGTKMAKIGPHWYILSSSGSDYRVYDLAAGLVGTLDAPHPSGWIPHPMVLPVPVGPNTRFIQLSMDGDGDPVSGAFGHLRVHEADHLVRGHEFR